ncbi:hypothetical protein ACB092_11G213300 [Castanea dentata]
MSMRASYRKLKEKAGEMDEKISNAEFVLVQSVQENANLRSKIVQSPDKLQSDLFDQVIAECSQHHLELQALIRWVAIEYLGEPGNSFRGFSQNCAVDLGEVTLHNGVILLL